MSNIKWSICMASVPQRREIRRRVIMLLEPQLASYNDIEFLIFEDNRKRDYGQKLQSLVNIAQGEYISFIDDDDVISESYVSTLYELMFDHVDCVTFNAHCSLNDSVTLPVYYSLSNTEPRNEESGYFRYVQHLNPVRLDKVRQVEYSGHSGADVRWSNNIRDLGLLKTENNTDKVLYYYPASTGKNREIWD
jgi:hypothetical protein